MLVRGHQLALHRRLCGAGVALAILLVATTVLATAPASLEAMAQSGGDGRFLYRQATDIGVFGIAFGLALAWRRDAAAHKRLVVLSTTWLLGAAFGRVTVRWLGPWLASLGDDLWLVRAFASLNSAIDVVLVAAVAYDWKTRGRVHPVNATGVPLLLVTQVLVAVLVQHGPSLTGVARSLVRP